MDKNDTDILEIRTKPDINITEVKYPELYEDEEFGSYLKIFRIILMFPNQKMNHELVKTIFKYEKNEYVTFIKNAEDILNIIGGDEQFASEFGIDINEIQHVLYAKIKKYKTDLKNKRATVHYLLHVFHKTIFKKLKSLGWGQTAQINFMYELYQECDYEKCRTFYENDKDDYSKKISIDNLKERIRKSQEKVFKKPF